MTYATRRDRHEAEKKRQRARRRAFVPLSMAGVAAFAGATMAGAVPAQAAMDDVAGVGPNSTSTATADTASTGTANTTSTTETASSQSNSAGSYTIKAGDTMGAIASAQGVSLNALLEANGMAATDIIYPNQVITIPGGSGSAAVSTASSSTASDASVGPSGTSTIQTASATTSAAPSSTATGWQGTAANWAIATANSGSSYYSYGGNGPNGFDCSSFTQKAMASAGKSLPRVSKDQFAAAPQHVSINNLQVGDLLFWSNKGSGSGVYHVAMYVGDGKIAQARNPQAGISVDSLSHYMQYNPPLSTAARY